MPPSSAVFAHQYSSVPYQDLACALAVHAQSIEPMLYCHTGHGLRIGDMQALCVLRYPAQHRRQATQMLYVLYGVPCILLLVSEQAYTYG